LANYTKVNLRQVDDQGPNLGLAPSMELRMARVALELENSGVSYLRVEPNFRVPYGHKHKRQEEIYVVVSGGGQMKLDDDVVELTQWDAVRMPAETMRGFEAGPGGAEIIAIGAPNTGPGDGDTTPGWWND
jgi:mannose-6-phosphate isomerase-like protein (cupin superfamily)